MTPRPDFHPLQAKEIARVDIFPARSAENGRRIVAALRKIDFDIGPELEGDMMASKRASGRQKDRIELPLLESFRQEYEKRHTSPLRSAADIAGEPARDQRDPP
ncbi:MAG: hypothetical protein KJ072_26315 [Verrucomicrobia bacterium]|nr:hypothetical protein [Verrucomicrobiota bacterium]